MVVFLLVWPDRARQFFAFSRNITSEDGAAKHEYSAAAGLPGTGVPGRPHKHGIPARIERRDSE
jgi:hypothetical protein